MPVLWTRRPRPLLLWDGRPGAGLRSLEEQRKREEEEEQEREARRQLQEPLELDEQQQWWGQPSEEPLEPPPHSPPQPVLPAPQEPENQEEGLRFSALRPRRGSVQGCLPRFQQNWGGRTAW